MKSRFFGGGLRRFSFVTSILLLSCATVSAADDVTPAPNKTLPPPASVVVSPNGFVIRQEIYVRAESQKVWTTLVDQVGGWWKSEHTFSKDSKNLSIDARPGGCFCERLPNGGGVEHLRVVHVKPGELLRLSGALGPLQTSALAGPLTWKLTGADGATKIELSYIVGGFMEGGFDKVAPAVDSVLHEQLLRLKSFVETGRPD